MNDVATEALRFGQCQAAHLGHPHGGAGVVLEEDLLDRHRMWPELVQQGQEIVVDSSKPFGQGLVWIGAQDPE